MCPAYSCTYFFLSDLVGNQLFRLRIAGVNAICFSSLVNSLVSGLAMVYCPYSLVSNQIYHRTDGIMLASSKYGKRQLVMKISWGTGANQKQRNILK